jgi:hypothetical protein
MESEAAKLREMQSQLDQQSETLYRDDKYKPAGVVPPSPARQIISGNNTMFVCYTISEDRTGSQESVTRQRLSVLGARSRKRKLQEFSYSSVREETNPMKGLPGGRYPREGGAGEGSMTGGLGMEAPNNQKPAAKFTG